MCYVRTAGEKKKTKKILMMKIIVEYNYVVKKRIACCIFLYNIIRCTQFITLMVGERKSK